MSQSTRLKLKVIVLSLGLVLLTIHGGETLAHKQSTVDLEVDCDTGDDLESMVNDAFSGVPRINAPRAPWLRSDQSLLRLIGERLRPVASTVRVKLHGTCTANLVVPSSTKLIIEGDAPESSIIQGALDEEGQAIDGVFRVQPFAELALYNLTIANGGGGIYGRSAKIGVHYSHFRETPSAVSAEFSDTFVYGCRIEFEEDLWAILAVKGFVTVLRTEIVKTGSSGGTGVLAELGATAIVESCEIDNFHAALSARRDSYMEGHNVTIGGSESEVQSFGGSFVTLRSSVLGGSARAGTSSTVHLRLSQVDGHVDAHAFGRVILESSEVTGLLSCDSSSDAICHGSSIDGGIYCDSCQQEPSSP